MADLGVIVNWNAERYLRDCLHSLEAYPPDVAWEVIVVDNASTDGSVETVRREFPAVVLIMSPANRGFAAGSNLGARATSARYILFLNPDTVMHAETLKRALDFMEDKPDVGVIGCRTFDGGGKDQPAAYGFPTPLRMFGAVSGLNRVFKVTRLRGFSRVKAPDYVQGSFFFVRRRAYEALGGFDEGFFMYAEDVDFCLRARRAGWKVLYIPELTITHFGGGSARGSLAALESFIRSLIILYRKHRTPEELRRLRRAMRWGIRLRRVFWTVRSPFVPRPERRKTRETFRRLDAVTRDL
ncbi:MAG: glycosyltransferase family 2 protein [Candidatus Aminicenantes bacterium]|nr:glycosyltransferase family 2 protein [Candidatus Aminicenantes bacterium]